MVQPLCAHLTNTWLNLAGSKHRQMAPFGFQTILKLLHHSSVSSTPSDMIICCSCRYPLFKWLLKCICYRHRWCLVQFYTFLNVLKNVPLKQLMPESNHYMYCAFLLLYCICNHVHFFFWSCMKIIHLL